jgi:cytochrome oxidase assembly protein ShyY1
MGRYRFTLRPKWILSHVLILVLIIVMINLGFWQLRRLHEKKTYNASVRANEAQAIEPVDAVLQPTDPTSRGSALAFRRVTITGTYDRSNEIIIRARSLDQRPGVWVASPLRDANGDAVIVVRGFLPSQGTLDSVPADAEPPTGTVTVQGLLQETQTKGLFEASDPSAGHLTDMARVDVERQKQIDYRLYPAWVQLQTSDPPQPGREPEVLGAPVLDEGPHFSYAIQWFIFSTIAIVGYPLILRRSARNRELKLDEDDLEIASPDHQMRGQPTPEREESVAGPP